MSRAGELTPKQRQVLERLLGGETVAGAAELEGVSKRQAFRWLRQDEVFKSTLRQAQTVMLDAVGVRLVRLAETAVSVLSELMDNPPIRQDAPGAGVQLRAAVAVLDACIRWKDVVDFEDRLAALEVAIHAEKTRAP